MDGRTPQSVFQAGVEMEDDGAEGEVRELGDADEGLGPGGGFVVDEGEAVGDGVEGGRERVGGAEVEG